MKQVLFRNLPWIIALLLWEAGGRVGWISSALVPMPSQILSALLSLVVEGGLLYNLARSLGRAATGLAAAVLVGTSIGVLMARYETARLLINPLVRMIYPLPKSAMIPMVMVWFGLGDLSKTFLIFIGCLLPIVVSAFNGARGVEPRLIWSARSLGASEQDIMLEILLPGALPEILAGIRTGLAFAFVLMVAGEFIIARDGIGFMISTLGDGGLYPAMFAAILAVVAAGYIADRSILLLSQRQLRWKAR